MALAADGQYWRTMDSSIVPITPLS